MNRRLAIALVLALLPAAGAAQGGGEHKEHGKTAEQQMAHHEAMVQSIIAKRAELNLTDAQVEKLNAFKTKVSDHHKMMMKEGAHGMKHDGAPMKSEDPAMAKMHEEFLAIFTDAQRVKVEELVKAHMEKCKSGEMPCKPGN